MVTLTTYICAVAGLFICVANAFVFHAVLKKRRPSTVDLLIGALCLHSITYYIASAILILIQKLTHPSWYNAFGAGAGECIAYYFAYSFPIILSVFFIDRYLATSHPLYYKIKVMSRHAYIVIFVSIILSILLTIFTMVHKRFGLSSTTVHFSYFLCISIVTVASFIVMVICYISICRALLYFAGRQMYIFGNEALFRNNNNNNNNNLPTVVENTNVASTVELETNFSADEIENPQQKESPSKLESSNVKKEQLCKKKSSLPAVLHKKSLASLGDHKKDLLAARAARYSCPVCIESKYHPDLPLWLIASLSSELLETRQRSQTNPTNTKDQQVQQNEPHINGAFQMEQTSSQNDVGRLSRERSYTMCNVVVNLIATRRKKGVDRGLRLSQARNLVQILTTKLVFYMFWLPFLIYSLILETKGHGKWQKKANTSLVWDMLRIALHIHMLSPTVYAFACHPYRVTLKRCWAQSVRLIQGSQESTI